MTLHVRKILRTAYSSVENFYTRLRGTKYSIRKQIATQQKQTYGRAVHLTKEEVASHTYTDDDEKRIEYYLGDIIGETNLRLNVTSLDLSTSHHPKVIDCDHISKAIASESMRLGYSLPVLNLFELLPNEYKSRKFLYAPGDRRHKAPYPGTIAKNRLRDDLAVTLLNLDPVRHWELVKKVPPNDIDYRQKKDMAVWRGATTGEHRSKGARIDLVNMLLDRTDSFNVGFSKTPIKDLDYAVKGVMLLKEQLQYKFLICLEGNDVASGLKWMLRSNSVVMMPKPTISSWLMEDTLEPFVHYIPLADDFSDVEERVKWAVDHDDECIEISNNASLFMSQFMDPRREIMIECEVFKRYLDKITFY